MSLSTKSYVRKKQSESCAYISVSRPRLPICVGRVGISFHVKSSFFNKESLPICAGSPKNPVIPMFLKHQFVNNKPFFRRYCFLQLCEGCEVSNFRGKVAGKRVLAKV